MKKLYVFNYQHDTFQNCFENINCSGLLMSIDKANKLIEKDLGDRLATVENVPIYFELSPTAFHFDYGYNLFRNIFKVRIDFPNLHSLVDKMISNYDLLNIKYDNINKLYFNYVDAGHYSDNFSYIHPLTIKELYGKLISMVHLFKDNGYLLKEDAKTTTIFTKNYFKDCAVVLSNTNY